MRDVVEVNESIPVYVSFEEKRSVQQSVNKGRDVVKVDGSAHGPATSTLFLVPERGKLNLFPGLPPEFDTMCG